MIILHTTFQNFKIWAHSSKGLHAFVVWQTEKAQKKCHIMWHFIKVFNACYYKTIFREGCTILFGKYYFDPLIYTMDHPKLIVSNQKGKIQ